MASDNDDVYERLIEDYRGRLRERIVVDPVLDHILFIDKDQKDQIRQKARTESNLAAADHLITAVLKKPRDPGWFRAFVDALEQSGCESAAEYMQMNPPRPEVEAENDYCVKLIDLLSPSLVDMKTEDVCVHCLSKGLINRDDSEIVSMKLSDHFIYLELISPSART